MRRSYYQSRERRRIILLVLAAVNLTVGQYIGTSFPDYGEWVRSWQSWIIVPFAAIINAYLIERCLGN